MTRPDVDFVDRVSLLALRGVPGSICLRVTERARRPVFALANCVWALASRLLGWCSWAREYL